MQADIPIQPNESDEVRALRQLAQIGGWCVTHTTDGTHARGSLHKVAATHGTGRAVDLGDRRGGVSDPPTPEQAERLLAINEAVIRLVPLSLISELIYGGPHNLCVRNGRRVDGADAYGATVMAGHHDHVHLAVTPGFVYNGSQGVPMPDNPDLPNITGPVSLHLCVDSNGNCTGYYIFSEKTAELHTFGDGAKIHYYGRSEVLGA